MRQVLRILLVVVVSVLLATAGAVVGGVIADAACTPAEGEWFPCMDEFATGVVLGGLIGCLVASVVAPYLWSRTKVTAR
jgi:hypothetical protein